MAMEGTLLADFNAFYTATQTAEQGLERMETQSFATAEQINKMTDKFTGQKVISEAAAMVEAVEKIGGASRLTDTELQKVAKSAAEATAKLKAMGQDVPATMEKYAGQLKQSDSNMQSLIGTVTKFGAALGVTFGVETLLNWGRAVLATADDLTRLSEQTGMTVEEVQRLSYVAGQSGNDLNQLTAASSKLQAVLDTVQGQDAIEKLGVDFERLRSAKPYQQLEMLSDAFRGIADPTERAQRAVEVFGESGAKILPTLVSDYRKLAAEANAASDAQVGALDAAGDAMDRFQTHVKTAAVGATGSLLLAGEQIAEQGLLATIKQWVDSPNTNLFLQQLTNIRAAALETEATLKKAAAEAGAPTGPGGQRETPKERAAREREEAAAKREHEQAAKALAEAQGRLDQVRLGSAGILKGIGEETVKAIERDLELGASQADLALEYSLTATQIAAVAKAYGEQKKAAEDLAKAEVAATKLVEEARRQWHADRLDLLATETDREKNAIEEWKARSLEALQATKGATDEQYAEIEAIARERLARVGIEWNTLKEGSIAHLKDQMDRATWTYNVMQADSDKYTAAAIANAKKLADEYTAQFQKATGAGNAMYAEWLTREAEFAAAVAGHDTARAQAAGAAADASSAAMDKAIAYAQAYGVTLDVAKAALGQTAGEAGHLAKTTDEAAAATGRLSVQMQNFGNAAMTAYERAIAGANLLKGYSDAGIATSGSIGLGGYEFKQLQETGVPGGWGGVGWAQGEPPWAADTKWGTGGGATQTTTNLNVNVNNADAQGIAEKLVTEMRHSGIRM